MARPSRAVVYGGLGVAMLAGVVYLSSPTNESGLSASEGRKVGSRSSRQVDKFDERDREARFERLNEPVRNTFRPLVARADVGLTGGGLAPNEFPTAYTGGEPGWFYTGTVIVDDVPSALVENQLTGEGLFLRVGENLKRATITQITPTYIVVRGVTGQSLQLDLLRDLPDPGDEEFAGVGIEPVRPNVSGQLQGPIGGTPRAITEQQPQRTNELP